MWKRLSRDGELSVLTLSASWSNAALARFRSSFSTCPKTIRGRPMRSFMTGLLMSENRKPATDSDLKKVGEGGVLMLLFRLARRSVGMALA